MKTTKNSHNNSSPLLSERSLRLQKLKKLIKEKQNPFFNEFQRQDYLDSFLKYQTLSNEDLLKKNISCKVAGRLMKIRNLGKIIFAILKDQSGEIQLIINLQESGEKLLKQFATFDVGDIIGICEGKLIKSKTNQLSILIFKTILLSKSLEPLPDKFHGLNDIEIRYRKRYLDLIVNNQARDVFKKRSQILHQIRCFLNAKNYLEVETPILQSFLTGAAAKPFQTHHNTLKMSFYLRVAPELYLKRLVVGHFERVYEIGKLFRNEGISPTHNPEFTALELYQAYGNMETMMQLTEAIFKMLAKKFASKMKVNYQGEEFDFEVPFARITMNEAVFKATKIDFSKITYQKGLKLAKEHKLLLTPFTNTLGHLLNLFFEKYVEKNLRHPTFIYQYPKSISPFAKQDKNNLDYTERFELFIGGREYVNAFSELNDPYEQSKRFQRQLHERKLGNEEANEIDADYIDALKLGLPPTGGMGIGIDRLVMFFTNQKNIKDVIFFPTLKKKES